MSTLRAIQEPVDRTIFGRNESNVRSYARSFPSIFTRARGAEVWDQDGRRYLDFLSGAGSLNFGHNNPALKSALVAAILDDTITHSLDLHTEPKARFLAALETHILAPRGLDYVVQFTGPTGANAIEAALKIARKKTGRSNVIHFTNGFHGVSLGALSVTGNSYLRKAAGVPLTGATVMPYDGFLGEDIDTLDILERMLSNPSSGVDEPAAIILECVQGEGGLNIAGTFWLKRLESLCRRRGIMLIVDDIQAGCGRTGTFFSFEHAGIKPDIVTLSKSLSGYGIPLSVVLIERSVDVWKPGEHNGTFRGNNHAFITATAMLETYWKTSDLQVAMAGKAEILKSRLNALVERFSPHLVDVKGRGMMIGIRAADADRAAAVTARAFAHGLIIERCGPWDEVIKCMMPLTIEEPLLKEGLDILERALEEEFGTGKPLAIAPDLCQQVT